MLGQKFYSKVASNKWWEKYKGEENVLIEDMDTTHTYQGYNMKIWADKYAFPVEIKFAADLIRPKIIIVTSNYTIQEVFPDPAIHLPLLERFKVIHKSKRWNANAFTELMPVEDSFEEIDENTRTNAKARFQKVQKSKPQKKRFRKFDQPVKKAALYRQNADGNIVANTEKQPLVSLALKEAQTIAKEPDLIEIMDSDNEKEVLEVQPTNPYHDVNYDEDGDPLFISGAYDQCNNCGAYIIDCICMESDLSYDKDENFNYSDSDYHPDDNEECSEDLFDI